MDTAVSLQELYHHPLIAEIVNENQRLRATLSQKPEVSDLKNIPLPYTIKRHILISAGVHNGTTYTPQILRMAVGQHEGLSIFLDHHDNDQGGTTQTWAGEIHNPIWSEADQAIIGDIDIVDPKTALAIAYGAKFGVSATADVEAIFNNKGQELANDPIFKSYALVLDPAVRETMLNERESEGVVERKMAGELDLKSDLGPALAKVDDAIRRASAMKDTSLLSNLQEVKAILSKLTGTSYPYPEPGRLEELEGKLTALEQSITKLTPSEPASEPLKTEELEALLKENEKMKEQLSTIEHDKLMVRADGILKKELELGLVAAADTDARKKELEAMETSSLSAVEQNLDKTIKILETDVTDTTPAAVPAPSEKEKKELSAQSKTSATLLKMMVDEQSKGQMPYGGK